MTNQHLEVVMAQLLKAPPVGLAGMIICIPLADQTEERLAVLVRVAVRLRELELRQRVNRLLRVSDVLLRPEDANPREQAARDHNKEGEA